MGSRLPAPLFFGMLTLTGAALFIHTFMADTGGHGMDESFLYPRVILALWSVFGFTAFVQSLKRHPAMQGDKTLTLLLAIAAMAFLCIALVPLGFLPTGFIFFIAYASALGYRKLTVVIPSAAGTTAALWFMFEKFLDIPLPMGIFAS